MHGHRGEQRRHRRLVEEGVEELGPVERRQDLRGDAATQEDTARRDAVQADVGGGAAVDLQEERQRLDARLVAAVDAARRHFGRHVVEVVLEQGRRLVAREAQQVDQAWSRQDVFVGDAPVAGGEELQQGDLARRPRREVGVAALGWRGHQAPVLSNEHRLAEAGAGREETRVAVGRERALLHDVELVGVQHRHAVRHRLDVVEQPHAPQPRRGHELARVHRPRDVGDVHRLLADRPGDADAGRLHLVRQGARRAEERRQHGRQAGEVARGVRAHVEEIRAPARRLEQAEQRLGAAQIAGEEHGAEDT